MNFFHGKSTPSLASTTRYSPHWFHIVIVFSGIYVFDTETKSRSGIEHKYPNINSINCNPCPNLMLRGGTNTTPTNRKGKNISVIIDRNEKRIRILDQRGIEVSWCSGFPRSLPKLEIMEVVI
jgi:hypothetical protein